MKTFFTVGTCFLLATSFLQAQPQIIVPPESEQWADIYDPPYKKPTELPVGSSLRNKLFDLLRSKATPKHKFAGSLKVYRNWAFFLGRTVDKEGKSLKTPPMESDDAVALWLRTAEGWKLIDSSLGHSDAFYIVWPEQYGVPGELLQ